MGEKKKKTNKKTSKSRSKPKLSADEKKRKEVFERLAKATGKKGTDMLFSAAEMPNDFEVISSGSEDLDSILTPEKYEAEGVGGIPRGFMCEFFGPEQGGKSSLAMLFAATVTARNGFVFWADAEGSFVKNWAISRGIDTKRLYTVPCGQCGEDYITDVCAAAGSGDFELAVIDSLAALEPQQLLETELTDDPRIGAKALMMSRACPRLTAAAKQGNCAIIFINQLRTKIGVKFGNPEITPGGKALKFYASLRLRIAQLSKKGRAIMKDEDEIGIRSNVQVVKSRFGPPYREAILPIYYGNEKPHPYDMLLDMALTSKVIRSRTKKVGDDRIISFTLPDFDDLKSIIGIDDFKLELRKDPEAIRELARRLVEDKNKALDGDVEKFVESCGTEDPLADAS